MKRLLAALLSSIIMFTGCSSIYINSRDEPPYQSEIIGSNLALEKVYPDTMLNLQLVEQQKVLSLQLVEQQKVVEHYNKVNVYERNALAGSILSITGGLIGAIYVSYKESWDNKTTLIASLSGVLIAIGIITSRWEDTYLKRKSLSKISSKKIDTNTAPVEVYLDGTLYQNVVADNYGRFALDLTPFVRNNKNTTFVFNFPKHSSFADTIVIPASYYMKLKSNKEERERALVIQHKKQAAEAAFRKEYPSGIEEITSLIMANPYDVKNRCFIYTGVQLQLLTRTSALYNTSSFICLLDFGNESAKKYVENVFVKGVGAFSYITTAGEVKIVPKLLIIKDPRNKYK